MTRKEELQNRKDQAESDLAAVQEKLEAEIARLKKKLEDEQETYSIGDRFRCDGAKYILTSTNSDKLVLINLGSGVHRNNGGSVGDSRRITVGEMRQIAGTAAGRLTRYYDHRKGELV